MPWHTSGRYAFSPINATSKKPYRGINTVCLWAAAQAKGLRAGRMGHLPAMAGQRRTSPQGREGHAGSVLEVRQRFQRIARRAKPAIHPDCCSLVATRVFNAAQVDGYTPKADADIAMPERIAHAEAFFQAIRADLRHGGNQAFYAPATDHIQMPPFGAFADNVSYYSTLAHEHTHWTAPAARCDRQLRQAVRR